MYKENHTRFKHTLLNSTNSIILYKKHNLLKNNEKNNVPKKSWYCFFYECFSFFFTNIKK